MSMSLMYKLVILTDLQAANQELSSQVSDLSEELKVKKSQVTALQMRLREAENLLIVEQENSEKLQNNVDMLVLVDLINYVLRQL